MKKKRHLKKRLEDIEKKNKQLQDTNHELFLRVTSPQKEQKQESEEKQVSLEEIAEQYKKEKNIK